MIYAFIVVAFIIYLFFLFYLLLGLQKLHPSTARRIQPFISIVLVTRNEEKNVSRCLDSLIRQNYPDDKFEIILIDDQSIDRTYDIADSIAQTFPGIRIFRNRDAKSWKSSKKRALLNALSKTRGSIIFLTDADCCPPPRWIEHMLACYEDKIGLVAGFSPQTSSKSFLWNHFLIIDSMAAAFVAAGSAGWGNGVTCTGRNLSFRLQACQESGGYTSTPDSLSGDDDFILQKINSSKIWNITYAFGKNTVVPAIGPGNFLQFIKQKQRHISAGKYFPLKYKTGYALFHFANLMLWFSMFYALASNFILIFFWLAKIAMDFIMIKIFAKKMEYNFSPLAFLPWECAFIFYHVLASPMTVVQKRKW
jgi:cellulose synthase/poly-beta-1,6-N-acetylglucosamine synthase-like glycosyltransferase